MNPNVAIAGQNALTYGRPVWAAITGAGTMFSAFYICVLIGDWRRNRPHLLLPSQRLSLRGEIENEICIFTALLTMFIARIGALVGPDPSSQAFASFWFKDATLITFGAFVLTMKTAAKLWRRWKLERLIEQGQ
jgi:hypothetical protein